MITRRTSGIAGAAALCAATTIAFGCSEDPVSPEPEIFKGPEIAVGAGLAWAEMAFVRGELDEVSLVFTPAALDNLPATLPATEYHIPLPSAAPATVYDHIGINWQPGGHPPPVVYTHPHFDVHFYLASVAERNAMTPANPAFQAKVTAMPTPQETPPRYEGDGFGIPRMGAHWANVDSHEFHGSPFTNTLIYGFYEGKMVFIEPMITRAFLLSRPDETRTMQVPQRYPQPGRYPKEWRVAWDAATGTYRVSLQAFATQQ